MSGQTVVVSVLADTKPFAKGFASAGSIASGFTKVLAAGAVAAGVALAGVTAFAVKAVEAAGEAQKVAAQTDAVLTSTGAAAGRTAKQVDQLATRLSRMSGIDDETVKAGENLLLTFTNIKGTNFDEATQSALDMSVAMGTDLQSSVLQLGKALNDPIAGVTKLQRVGVTFSQQQKDQIANYVKLGQTAQAQQVILDEVNREFGGSAQAFGNTWEGAVGKVKTAFQNIKEEIGGSFLPALAGAASGVAGVLDAITDNPKFTSWLDSLGSKLSAGFKPISDLLATAASSDDPFGSIVNGLADISPVFAVLKGIFDGLKPELPLIQQGFAQLGSALGSGIAKYGPQLADAFGQIVQAVVPLVPDLLALIPALLPLIPPLLQLAEQIIPPLASLLGTVLPPAIQAVTAVLGLLGPAVAFIVSGMNGAFTAIGAVFSLIGGDTSLQGFLNTALAIPGPVGAMVSAAVAFGSAVGTAIGQGVAAVQGFLGSVINTGAQIVGFFVGLPGQIQSALAGAATLLVGIGANLIEGLIKGIKGAVGGVTKFVSSIGSDIANAFKKALGIHSPSTVFAGFGQNIIAGLQKGLTAVSVVPTIRGIADNMSGAFAVQLATPNTGVSGNPARVGGLTDPGARVQVSIVQNNPVTRDPLKQLREDSENLAAGLWG